MASLQSLVFKFETMWNGRGWRIGLGGLFVLLLGVGYNWRAFHNLNNAEAMDAAQLGRNLAQGRGYTTQFIRPFSIYLIQERNQSRTGKSTAALAADPAQLRGPHPDLANPPVYPVVLAGQVPGECQRCLLEHSHSATHRRHPASIPALSAGLSDRFVQSSLAGDEWPARLFSRPAAV